MENDGQSNSSSGDNPLISKDITTDVLSTVLGVFNDLRYSSTVPPNLNHQGSYSDLFRQFLEVRQIERAKVSCVLTVKPSIEVNHDEIPILEIWINRVRRL